MSHHSGSAKVAKNVMVKLLLRSFLLGHSTLYVLYGYYNGLLVGGDVVDHGWIPAHCWRHFLHPINRAYLHMHMCTCIYWTERLAFFSP
jgi:hypothetical protein